MHEASTNNGIERRLFMFGCQRSGTTLLQVALARHPDIYSTPETEFFRNTVGSRRGWLARLGLTTGKERHGLRKTCEAMRLDGQPLEYKPSLFYRTTVDTFRDYLDSQALRAGCSMWLEKSPEHLFHVDVIRKYMPNARFIHIFRRGEDVLGSILDRAFKYLHPASRLRDPMDGVQRWNRAIHESLRYVDSPGHAFVEFESLARVPEVTLRRLCRQLDIPYVPELTDSGELDQVISRSRPHLANSSDPIEMPESKFEALVPDEDKEQVLDALDTEAHQQLVDRFGLPDAGE